MGLYKSTTVRKRKDGTTYKVRSKKWYGAFQHPRTGKRVHLCLGVTDKTAAGQLLAVKITETAKDHAGLGDRYRIHEQRGLEAHVDDWHAVLLAKGRTANHARQERNYVRRIISGCRFRKWADITPDALIVWLGGTGLSIASQNGYKQALKQFCGWMAKSSRANPIDLSDVTHENADRDRRHKRRALSADECRRILAAALDGPPVYGLTGEQRYKLYRVSLATGTRPIELSRLQWYDFRLDRDQPSLIFDPRFTKNGKTAIVPLRGDMPALLRRWQTESDCVASAFKTPSASNMVRMFRVDLAAAEIPYRDDAGHVADFYCLRSTFGTMLAEAGVPVKELQELMRHATIQTTMKYYIHVADHRKVEAIDKLPDLSGSNPNIIRLAEAS